MILKVAFAQPVYDHRKHDLQRPKDGLNKRKSASFAIAAAAAVRLWFLLANSV